MFSGFRRFARLSTSRQAWWVHPAAGHKRSGTLSRGARGGSAAAAAVEPWRPGIVHRLARDTSGLLVVAKSESTHRGLKDRARERRIVREYLPSLRASAGTRRHIDAPLGRDRRARAISLDSAHARSRTHSRSRRRCRLSLLRVRSETGRTHQIRAHFEAIGHPVCGDPEYGHAHAYGLSRQFLHATRLEFEQPFSASP